MCGISGFAGPGAAGRRDLADRQIALLDHRGPDAHGVFVKPDAVLAQNRLAVIDLVSGDPPLTDESGDVGAVLNGEIYNFQALREELAHAGHRFSSRGDTEVLAHLAEEEDDPRELARRLDGMFAFATWDERRRRLLLGRDRLGKKPLYYAMTSDGQLVFASEIKALLAHPGVPREFDPSVLPSYLLYGYVPSPGTVYGGIQSVPPGAVLAFTPGGEPRVVSYWEPPLVGHNAGAHADLSLRAAAAGVRERLERAVERRLVADVPLGAYLSGGIDSSAIVALAADRADHRLSTFTIGFEDTDGFDERPYAKIVARRYGTDHHEWVVQPEAVDLVDRLVWHYDQPFGDSSAIPTYLLAELTRRHVTVALSGDGGDELFGGYERFLGGLLLARYNAAPSLLRRGVDRTLEAAASSPALDRARRFTASADRGLPIAYESWAGFVSEADRDQLLRGQDGAGAAHARIWEASAGAATLDRLLDLNLRTYLLGDLLPKADRMSMAHALEVRSPFLDAELLDYAARLPPALKIRGPVLKRVLKAAVADLLPSEIVKRRKRGFGVPVDRWFRTDLREYVTSRLTAPDARLKEWLDPGAVDALVADHVSGRRNSGHSLWTLLTLEVFLRERIG